MARIVVIGSINIDRVCHCSALPRPGETVVVTESHRTLGGKGGNQARAAAGWAGLATYLVGAVGVDEAGRGALAELERRGVNTDHVNSIASAPTGVATVLVDDGGENMIVVSAGANSAVTAGDVDRALSTLAVDSNDVVVTSGETPDPCVLAAARHCRARRVTHVHNLSPARDHAWLDELQPVLILNRHEAETLAATDHLPTAATALAARFQDVVITRGAEGVLHGHAGTLLEIPAVPAGHVEDSTGAGDAFCGALVAELVLGSSVEGAVRLAVHAGAHAVRQPGAPAEPMLRTDAVDAITRAGGRSPTDTPDPHSPHRETSET